MNEQSFSERWRDGHKDTVGKAVVQHQRATTRGTLSTPDMREALGLYGDPYESRGSLMHADTVRACVQSKMKSSGNPQSKPNGSRSFSLAIDFLVGDPRAWLPKAPTHTGASGSGRNCGVTYLDVQTIHLSAQIGGEPLEMGYLTSKEGRMREVERRLVSVPASPRTFLNEG